MKLLFAFLLLINFASSEEIQVRAFGPNFDSNNKISTYIFIEEKNLTKIVIELKTLSESRFEIIAIHGMGSTNADFSFRVIDETVGSKLILAATKESANESMTRVFAVIFTNNKLDHGVNIREISSKKEPELWRLGLEISSNGKMIEQIEKSVIEMKGRIAPE